MKTCYEKALELLGRRSHFRQELKAKLARRGDYEESEISQTLDRLAEGGHLDDRSTAEQLVAERLRRRPEGPRRLLAELLRRGVDGDVAQTVVDSAIDDELTLAEAAADRWRARSNAGEQALARHLTGRGFTPGAIRSVLDL